jgi:hypothetical protein
VRKGIVYGTERGSAVLYIGGGGGDDDNDDHGGGGGGDDDVKDENEILMTVLNSLICIILTLDEGNSK